MPRSRQVHKISVAFITVVPSPYQRDLFSALADREDLNLEVHYMEPSSPDSPWPLKSLRPYERIMPGSWFSVASARIHYNWALPNPRSVDFTVVSSYATLTGQWLIRKQLRNTPWLFWGERLHERQGVRSHVQTWLSKPFAKAAAIVGIGRAAELDYMKRFPTVPHFCIPYHCNLDGFFQIKRLPPRQDIRFLFCGQMIERKGVDLLLTAFDMLIKEGRRAKLILVGREADLPRFLNNVSPAARDLVEYKGFQAPESLPDFFSQAHVFVIPSRHDGWGVVVNQALAAGLPVISSTAVGAGLDLVDDDITGKLVRTGDIYDLRRAMDFFIQFPSALATYGTQARLKATEITPEAGAQKWVDVFNTLHRQR